MNLYQLDDTLIELENILADETLTDDERDAAATAYLETAEALHQKIDGYCVLIQEVNARAEAREKEAARLDALVEADRTLAKRLQDRLHAFCQGRELTRLETARFKISVQKNGGKLPVVIVDGTQAEQLDERFHRVIPARIEINKDAVREALESGENLNFAQLGERGTRLVIK